MKHARDDYDPRIQDKKPADEGGIPADEPVFLIRGQDVAAPHVVRFYADWCVANNYYSRDSEFVKKCRTHADAMERWQREVKAKVPDLPSRD